MRLVVYLFMILFALSVAEPLKIWAQDETEEKANNDTTKTSSEDKDKKKKKPKEPKFEDLIEDYTKTEGLFTIYSNEKEGKVYLEIRQPPRMLLRRLPERPLHEHIHEKDR